MGKDIPKWSPSPLKTELFTQVLYEDGSVTKAAEAALAQLAVIEMSQMLIGSEYHNPIILKAAVGLAGGHASRLLGKDSFESPIADAILFIEIEHQIQIDNLGNTLTHLQAIADTYGSDASVTWVKNEDLNQYIPQAKIKIE